MFIRSIKMRILWVLFGTYCILQTTYGYSVGSFQSQSLVISPRLKRAADGKESVANTPNIYEMNVHTNVSNRYAKTLITTKVKNSGSKAQETEFSVVTPDQAFISGFVMEIDGKKYEAYVQEKEEAKQTYDRAVAAGQAAGHVAVNARDSKRFTVQVNVESESKVTFYLTYEELLKRDNNKYQIVLNIQPGQPVEKLEATVDIQESRKLKFVDTPSLRSGNEILRTENEDLKPNADIKMINDTAASVKFHPSVEDQKKFAKSLKTDPDNGLQGQFIVEYDVERDPQGGEVLVDESYFVHFFAPSELNPLPKQVIFVLDTSGSMYGTRIEQMKGAMNTILEDLKAVDVFGIVEFNSIVKVWNIEKEAVQYETQPEYNDYLDVAIPEVTTVRNTVNQTIPPSFEANADNIKKAKQVIDKMEASGGTDIYSALNVALKMIRDKRDDRQPLILFLTDGEATVGTTDNEKIISSITESNTGECPIFSISLGDGADRNFLQKIALKNNAFSKHIYEGADVSLQLEDYYKGISSPLLSNVTFKYVSEVPDVEDVTKERFPILFGGKEFIVAGKKGSTFEVPSVDAWSKDGPVSLKPKVVKAAGSLERLWAYLTLKQLLENKTVSEDKNITAEALKLALKYSFVSDVTSLVVVKPNVTSNQAVDLEDGSISRIDTPAYAAGGYAARPQFGYLTTTFRPQFLPTFQSIGQPAPSISYALEEEESFSLPTEPATTGGSQLELLKSKLPWLDSVLNNNGSISVSTGTYELGLENHIETVEVCQNPPTNSTQSLCKQLDHCSQVYDVIDSLQKYEKHMCILNGYAGVCCPSLDS